MVSLVPRLRRKGHAEELRRVGLGPREGLPLPETATARTAEKPWGTWQFHPDNMGNIYENMDNNNMAVSRYKWGFKMI
jgi:hypothetical protein